MDPAALVQMQDTTPARGEGRGRGRRKSGATTEATTTGQSWEVPWLEVGPGLPWPPPCSFGACSAQSWPVPRTALPWASKSSGETPRLRLLLVSHQNFNITKISSAVDEDEAVGRPSLGPLLSPGLPGSLLAPGGLLHQEQMLTVSLAQPNNSSSINSKTQNQHRGS